MFETLTMRPTPANSAASIAFVSSWTWSRVGEETRNMLSTPTRTWYRSETDGAPGAGVRTAHTGALGLERESLGPRHRCESRRGHVVQPVGHLVGGSERLRHLAPRRRRRDHRRPLGRDTG